MSGLIFPALLCGIFSYLGGVDALFPGAITSGYYCIGRPLVAGLLCGLAFGDITAGVLCGLAVQAVFIATLSTGGASNAEITYASYGGIGLALATTKDPAVAVTLALLCGNVGLILFNMRMAVYALFCERAEAAAYAGDERGITLWHVVIPQICTFVLRFTPVFLAIVFGSNAISGVLSQVPDQVNHIIGVLGGVLPALGVAMLMSVIIKKPYQMVFFFFGFVLLAFAGLSTIPVVCIAAVVAVVLYVAPNHMSGDAQVAVRSSSSTSEEISSSGYVDEDLF